LEASMALVENEKYNNNYKCQHLARCKTGTLAMLMAVEVESVSHSLNWKAVRVGPNPNR